MDCTGVPKPDNCNIGDEINVLACDRRNESHGWVSSTLRCVILEE